MTKKHTGPRQEPEEDFEQAELSETWRELLGKQISVSGIGSASWETDGDKDHLYLENRSSRDLDAESDEKAIPTLQSDPWRSLIQAKGVEIVDLHKTRLQISDQEVERILKVIQEYPAQDKDAEDADLS